MDMGDQLYPDHFRVMLAVFTARDTTGVAKLSHIKRYIEACIWHYWEHSRRGKAWLAGQKECHRRLARELLYLVELGALVEERNASGHVLYAPTDHGQKFFESTRRRRGHPGAHWSVFPAIDYRLAMAHILVATHCDHVQWRERAAWVLVELRRARMPGVPGSNAEWKVWPYGHEIVQAAFEDLLRWRFVEHVMPNGFALTAAGTDALFHSDLHTVNGKHNR